MSGVFNHLDENLETEIVINPNNSMKAKYVLYAVDNDDILTEISVILKDESDINTEISPRVRDSSEKETEIDIVYADKSEVLVEIQPYGHINLPIEIEVRPHNRMWARYEVQQPPIVTTVYNPIQDSFTREMSGYQSINYGSTKSMIVGTKGNDITRSYVQFDFGQFNPSYVITDVKLRLYYDGVAPKHLKLQIHSINDPWLENSITHLNRPVPYELVSDEFIVEESKGYVEFDVRDIVEEWIEGKRINYGFAIRVENETVEGQAIFGTRESMRPPELVIDHYDSRIFSAGRSQVLTEIEIIQSDESDINTEVTVGSTYSFSTIETELRVHVNGVPFEEDILTEITVSKAKVESELTVVIAEDDDKLAEISVWYRIEEKKNTEITVNRPSVPIEIFSAYGNNIETEITVQRNEDTDRDTEITVNRPLVEVEITPNFPSVSERLTEISITREVVPTEIEIVYAGNSDIDTEIESVSVYRSEVLAEITFSRDSVATEISPRIEERKDLRTEITVTRKTVYSEIYIKYRDEIEIEIEASPVSKTEAEVTVSKPHIYTEISVQAYDESEKDIEIFVSYVNEIETEIDARSVSQVEVEIEARSVSQIDTEISVTKKKVHAEIIVPYYAEYDVFAEVSPRILLVSNIDTLITVGSKRGAYVFIM